MQYLIFDIETALDGALIQKTQFPTEELSPKAAILKYQEQMLEASHGKSNFIPHTYHLPVSLALVGVNESFEIVKIGSLDRGTFRPHIIAKEFWQTWTQRNQPTMVTFNGRGFDIPVLELCAFRYGFSVPQWFSSQGPSYTQPRNRFNPNSHFDIMEFLTNFGATRFTGGLNLAATLLGKPGKMDTKGSMVQEMWEAGEKLAIDDYCICDALDTYFAFLRTQVVKGSINQEQEHKIVEKAYKFIEQQSHTLPILQKYLADFTFWEAPTENEEGFLENTKPQ